jgi:hypothetical protein
MLPHLLARSRFRWAGLSAYLAAAVSLLPAPARACSWGQVILESSYPRLDAVDVPTNAVLFVYGPELRPAAFPGLVPDELQLVDESGQSVAFDIQAVVPSGFDLAPLEPLQPNQSYQLVPGGPSPYPLLEFTTGSGPAAVPESLSTPELDVVQFSYALGSCGVLAGLCVEAAAAPNTTLELRVGDEVLAPGAGLPSPLSRAYSQPLADGDCVEVRARDVRGHRSAPRTVCGEAIARLELPPDNFEVAYTCDNYLDYVGRPTPQPELATPATVPVGEVSPLPQNASPPQDVAYVADGVDQSALTGSDAVIYDDVPSVRSSGGCTLTGGTAPASARPGRPAAPWRGLGLAVVPLGAALLGARRRRR